MRMQAPTKRVMYTSVFSDGSAGEKARVNEDGTCVGPTARRCGTVACARAAARVQCAHSVRGVTRVGGTHRAEQRRNTRNPRAVARTIQGPLPVHGVRSQIHQGLVDDVVVCASVSQKQRQAAQQAALTAQQAALNHAPEITSAGPGERVFSGTSFMPQITAPLRASGLVKSTSCAVVGGSTALLVSQRALKCFSIVHTPPPLLPAGGSCAPTPA